MCKVDPTLCDSHMPPVWLAQSFGAETELSAATPPSWRRQTARALWFFHGDSRMPFEALNLPIVDLQRHLDLSNPLAMPRLALPSPQHSTRADSKMFGGVCYYINI